MSRHYNSGQSKHINSFVHIRFSLCKNPQHCGICKSISDVGANSRWPSGCLARCVGWCVACQSREAFGVLALHVYIPCTMYISCTCVHHHNNIIKVQMYLILTGDIQDQFLEFTE